MKYFTALGITTFIIGTAFLFSVLAVPIEVIGSYFTPVVQVVITGLTLIIYFVALQRISKRKLLA